MLTAKTQRRIKAYSRDKRHSDSLESLMDYYGVARLQDVSEEMAQEFLSKLQSGEIRVGNY